MPRAGLIDGRLQASMPHRIAGECALTGSPGLGHVCQTGAPEYRRHAQLVTTPQGRGFVLSQRDVDVRLPLLQRRVRIDTQVVEEQGMVAELFVASG